MFSFFKKNTAVDDSKLDVSALTQQEKEDQFFSDDNIVVNPTAIEVSEGDSALGAEAEQAAVMFASGQTNEAIAFLSGIVEQYDVSVDVWLMLFELYQQQHYRVKFDDLAVKFAEKFSRSAPVWRGGNARPSDVANVSTAVASAGSTYFAFTAQLIGHVIAEQVGQLKTLANSGKSMRVDFSKIQQIDHFSAAQVLQLLQSKSANKFEWQGLENLVQLLSPKIEMMRPNPEEKSYWLLLLEATAFLDRQEEFENLAVDYAVTYEVSPPSWDPERLKKMAAIAASSSVEATSEEALIIPAADSEYIHAENAFVFSGVLDSDVPFEGLREYAEGKKQLVLDFYEVPRVDFVAAGSLLNKLMAFVQESKPVKVVGANELIVGLFRVMGIAELVSIDKRRY